MLLLTWCNTAASFSTTAQHLLLADAGDRASTGPLLLLTPYPLVFKLAVQPSLTLLLTQFAIIFPIEVGSFHLKPTFLDLCGQVHDRISGWIDFLRLLLWLSLRLGCLGRGHYLMLSLLVLSPEVVSSFFYHSYEPTTFHASVYARGLSLILEQKLAKLHISVDTSNVKRSLL